MTNVIFHFEGGWREKLVHLTSIRIFHANPHSDCCSALDIWKLSWNTGELWVLEFDERAGILEFVATQDQISSHSDLLEVWRQEAQFVATQDQISSHSDLLEVWRQGAQFVATQFQITSHRQVAKPQRQRFQLIATQVQTSSAQDVSKGLREFSNVAEAQVPALQQSIVIKAAPTEHSVHVRIRIQDHELLHQPLGCLLVPTLAKQVRNNW